MKILRNLSKADLVSLGALTLSWLAIISILVGNVRLGIFLSLLSFISDLFDGYVARRTGKSSPIGKYLDVHVDVFIYLVFTNVLFLFYVVDINAGTLLASTVVLICGVLRLIRFTDSGIVKTQNKEYYTGFPVYFPYLFVIYSYFFEKLSGLNIDAVVEIVLVILGFLMISEIKNLKTRNIFVLGSIVFSIFLLNYYAHK